VNITKKTGLSLLTASILTGLLFLSLSLAEEAEEEKELARVPDFQLKDLEGQRVALDDLLGKGPILISFWATWCKPCIKEMPHLHELYHRYKEHGFLVVAISEDSPRSLSKVKSFIAGKKYDFLVLLDENNAVQRKFNFRALPYTLLLDEEGRMVYSRLGYRPGDEKMLEEKLLPLIKAKEEQEDAEQAPEGEDGEQKKSEADEGKVEETKEQATEKEDVKKVKKGWAQEKSAEGCDE
jgi:cytochrome c biogenesis protein CcmG/thiol:disulfide interchange protein DsbE